ncbi:MAG: hypothetical protein HN878_02775 [Candidatus Diapherotrites archaeon]|nr:hypothetical protein [Candidatus Diapherotrites archaeon]
MSKEVNAQGAIEYLLIIAAAILVVSIVILAVTGALGSGQNQTSQGIESQENAFDQLKASQPGSIKLNGKVYSKSSSMQNGLIGLWHLDETSGDAIDSSISSNNGLVFEALPGQPGYFGNQAYLFDGANDYIGIDHSSTLTPNNVTVSVWFNSNDITKRQMFVSKTQSGGYNLSLNENSVCPDDVLCFLVRDSAGYKATTADPSLLQNNTWYYLVGTYDGDTAIIYLNGSEIKRNEILSGDIVYVNDVPLCIGSEPKIDNTCLDGMYVDGLIGEVAIWDRALSADEVLELWDNAQ